MRSPSNSNGTTIPCSWSGSLPVLCCLHIACPPADLVFLCLPSLTKDKLVSPFSPTFTLKDGEPQCLSTACVIATKSTSRDGVDKKHPNHVKYLVFKML